MGPIFWSQLKWSKRIEKYSSEERDHSHRSYADVIRGNYCRIRLLHSLKYVCLSLETIEIHIYVCDKMASCQATHWGRKRKWNMILFTMWFVQTMTSPMFWREYLHLAMMGSYNKNLEGHWLIFGVELVNKTVYCYCSVNRHPDPRELCDLSETVFIASLLSFLKEKPGQPICFWAVGKFTLNKECK